jgi:hypothetical protein
MRRRNLNWPLSTAIKRRNWAEFPTLNSSNNSSPIDKKYQLREDDMDTREAILNLEYSEKMKSGLIIGSGLLNQLMSLKDEELSGGKKILVGYLEGLLREVRIAGNIMASDYYLNLERKVMEVIGRVQMSQLEEAIRSFSEAISLATTLCQSSMTLLMEKKLI